MTPPVLRRLRRVAAAIAGRDELVRFAELYLQRAYRWREQRDASAAATADCWFDHRADLYRWSELQNPMWVERGVLARAVMSPGCRVLDLGCGDGFYAFHFYAAVASVIDAVDRNAQALALARRRHADPRIRYLELDVVTDEWPPGPYDVICWDASIQYFAPEDSREVLRKARAGLTARGVVCGSTIVGAGYRHRQTFADAAALEELLLEEFPNVATTSTTYPERTMVYFRAAADDVELADFRVRRD